MEVVVGTIICGILLAPVIIAFIVPLLFLILGIIDYILGEYP